MGKKSKKRGVWARLNDFATLPVIVLIGFLLWDKLENINDGIDSNRNTIASTQSDLTGLRLDIVRIHPQIGLAAYSVASSADDIDKAEIPEIFDILLGLELATDPEIVTSRLRRVESLNERQIERLANAYVTLDPTNVENWLATEYFAIMRGLELSTTKAMFAASVNPEPAAGLRNVLTVVLWLAVAFAVLLPLAAFIESKLAGDDESSE